MSKTLHSDRHKRLAELLVEKRKLAGMTQAAVAKALGRHQPFVANLEMGDRRIDVIELLDLAQVLGFDPNEVISQLQAVKPKRR
jgi:HTH-type transcriptional regulator/antitoxin HipB